MNENVITVYTTDEAKARKNEQNGKKRVKKTNCPSCEIKQTEKIIDKETN